MNSPSHESGPSTALGLDGTSWSPCKTTEASHKKQAIDKYNLSSTRPILLDALYGAAGIQHLVENSRHRWICALARVVTAGGGWGLCHFMCEGGKLRDRVEAIFC